MSQRSGGRSSTSTAAKKLKHTQGNGNEYTQKQHQHYVDGSDGYGISDRTPQAKSKYDYRHGGAATQYSTAEKKLETHHLNYGGRSASQHSIEENKLKHTQGNEKESTQEQQGHGDRNVTHHSTADSGNECIQKQHQHHHVHDDLSGSATQHSTASHIHQQDYGLNKEEEQAYIVVQKLNIIENLVTKINENLNHFTSKENTQKDTNENKGLIGGFMSMFSGKNEKVTEKDTTISNLQSQVDKLQNKVDQLQNKVDQLQTELRAKESQLKFKESQLKRLGGEHMRYLKATGNITQAENKHENAVNEFKALWKAYIKFIDSLEDNITKSKAIIHNAFPTITEPDEVEDAIAVILAECIQVAYQSGIVKLLELLQTKCNENLDNHTRTQDRFIIALTKDLRKGKSCHDIASVTLNSLYNIRKGKPQQIFIDCQLFFQSAIESNESFKDNTMGVIIQVFQNAVKTAFRRFGIEFIEDTEHFTMITMNTAEVIWKLITLPDPMLLHLKTTDELRKKTEAFDPNKFDNRNKTFSGAEYEIDAYTFPMLINSYEGKIIEKGKGFVRKKS